MSALNVIAQLDGVSLSAATAKTVMQLLAPSNHRIRIKEIGLSFQGTSNTDTPGLVQLLYQTGGTTVTSIALVKEDESLGETIQSTAKQTFTVAPTDGNVIRTWRVHPQSGLILPLPLGDEIILGGGKIVGLKMTFAQAQSASAYIRFEE